MVKMWMVRAGEKARLIEDFLNENVVALGWNEIGDISNKRPKDIKNIVREKYPEYSKGKAAISAGQIIRFLTDIKKGDRVITYNPPARKYHVGIVEGPYEYLPGKLEFHHIRKVRWIGEVDRDTLSINSKNSLGAISSLFLVPDEAEKEIMEILMGKKTIVDGHSEDVIEELKEDMTERSLEFIKDLVMSLNWEQMQELVAGLLRAMGYKTIVSRKGADRGKDIIASPDGLGLEEPRIVVEVKHRNGQMGSHEIRSFLGALRQGNKGLYVSTGGFSKDARYEAERSTIPLTLIDVDLLVNLIIQYYDDFDTETRRLLPLVKIYWPA